MSGLDLSAFKDSFKDGIAKVGENLLHSATFSQAERDDIVKWTKGLAEATLAQNAVAAANYKVALNTMLAIAEKRAADAADKALISTAQVALDIIVKMVIAAI